MPKTPQTQKNVKVTLRMEGVDRNAYGDCIAVCTLGHPPHGGCG